MNNMTNPINDSCKFNAAIIGCGAIHALHADTVMNSPLAVLSSVADIDPARAKASSEKYNCNYFTDYTKVLEDENIDVIHICTPHYLHADMAIAAMEHGKHVILEKPMAIKLTDAEKLIYTSDATGKQLGICFQNRYNTSSVKAKSLLTSGRGGKLLGARAFVTWCRDEEYYTGSGWRGTWEQEGGGVLINQSIHTLDLLQWFMGDIHRIKGSVDTRALKEVIEVEDTAEAAIQFKSGATALFYATNCYCANAPVMIEIVTENAVIKIEDGLTIKYNNGDCESYSEVDRSTGAKAYWGSSHKTLIEDFYSRLAEGTKFPLDGSEGIKALQMLHAIYSSSKSGEYIEL